MIQLLTDKYEVCKITGQKPKHPKVGTYETRNISLHKLKDLLPTLTKHQFLLSGFLAKTKGRYKGKDMVLNLGKSTTTYKEGQLTLVGDIDGKWFTEEQQLPQTAEGIYNLLIQLNPLLKDTQLLISPSSSSGVCKKGDTPQFTSWHIYARITRIKHMEEWAKAHHLLCFDDGWGNIVHNKGMGVMSRSLFDLSIYQQQRPIFEADAIITEEYIQHPKPKAEIFGTEPLDFLMTKPKPIYTEGDLSDDMDEYREFNKAYLKSREEYKVKHPDRYIAAGTQTIELTQLIKGKKTVADLVIDALSSTAQNETSLIYCQDPLEPEEGDGRASLVWLGANSLYIHSFLHGEQRYQISLNFSILAHSLKASDINWKQSAKLLYRLVDAHLTPTQRIKPIVSSLSVAFSDVKLSEKDVRAYLTELQTSMTSPSNIYEEVARWTGFDQYSMVKMGASKPLYVNYRNGNLMFNSTEAMKESATNKAIWVESRGELIDGFTALRASKDRVQYELVVMDPSERNAPDELNLFSGFHAVPAKGDATPILLFLKNIICSGDDKLYSILLHFLADLFQNPAKKPTWAVVLVSKEKGTGKGTLQQFMSDMVGFAHTYKFRGKDSLTQDFNALYAVALYGYMEEMRLTSADDKEALKDKITEKNSILSAKYKDETMIQQYQRFIFATNSREFIPYSAGERRFLILEVSNKWATPTADNEKNWRDLHSWWEDGNGMNIFMGCLMNMELGPLPLVAPVTSGAWASARDNIAYENPYIEALFRIVIEDGEIDNGLDGYIPLNKYIKLKTLVYYASLHKRTRFSITNADAKHVSSHILNEYLPKSVFERCKQKSPVQEFPKDDNKGVGIEPSFELMLCVCNSIAPLEEFKECKTIEELRGVVNGLT